MRILGLDVGEKRIGVARVDTNTKIAVPVDTINVDGTEWQEISRLTRLYNTSFFVLGLPRSNEGNETAQSLYVRNFSKTLTEKIPDAKIRFQDESLTSIEAETRLKSRKKSYQKSDIDAEAASIILQDFIENFQEKLTDTKKNPNLIEKNAEKAMLNTKKIVHKTKKKVAKFLIIPPAIVIIAMITGGILWYNKALTAINTCEGASCVKANAPFTINDGDTIDIISKNLEKAGFIRSSLAFKIYLKLNHSNTTLKSGTYILTQYMSVSTIVDIFATGSQDSQVFDFTILPGETIFDVKDNLADIGYSSSEIEAAFSKDYDIPLLKNKPADASLEGYLLGETHQFYIGDSVETILEKFLWGSNEIFEENNLAEGFSAHGLTVHEGIILASIVQKEAKSDDQPIVAQVFYSRLAYGWKLGSDVTVSYAVSIVDPDRNIYQDNSAALDIDSCYNTRKYTGLPCGAISNPSISALLAVANPSDTDYLYFLTGDDGMMYYSYTEEEHMQNIQEHCQILCNVSL